MRNQCVASYATRTPTAVIMTSPPTPGRATAASAHIEARAGIPRHAGNTTAHPSGQCRAALAVPSRTAMTVHLVPSHRAMQPRLLRVAGRAARPECRQGAGLAALCDAPDTPAAIPNPSPSMPPNPSTTGATLSGAQQEGGKVKRQLRKRDDRTGNIRYRRHRVDNRRHRVSNRRHRVSNRRDRVSNRRDRSGTGLEPARPRPVNRRDRRLGTAATGLGALGRGPRPPLVLSIRAASPCRGASSGRGRLAARAKRARWAGGRLVACLPARTNRARYIPNGLPHSVSNIADCAVSRRAALRWRVTVIPIRAGTEGIGDSDRSPTQ